MTKEIRNCIETTFKWLASLFLCIKLHWYQYYLKGFLLQSIFTRSTSKWLFEGSKICQEVMIVGELIIHFGQSPNCLPNILVLCVLATPTSANTLDWTKSVIFTISLQLAKVDRQIFCTMWVGLWLHLWWDFREAGCFNVAWEQLRRQTPARGEKSLTDKQFQLSFRLRCAASALQRCLRWIHE